MRQLNGFGSLRKIKKDSLRRGLATIRRALPLLSLPLLTFAAYRAEGNCYSSGCGGQVCITPGAVQTGSSPIVVNSCSGGTERVNVAGTHSGSYSWSSLTCNRNVTYIWNSGITWTNNLGTEVADYGGGGSLLSNDFSGSGSASFANKSSSYTTSISCPNFSYEAATQTQETISNPSGNFFQIRDVKFGTS
jgi:hypothetical protein